MTLVDEKLVVEPSGRSVALSATGWLKPLRLRTVIV